MPAHHAEFALNPQKLLRVCVLTHGRGSLFRLKVNQGQCIPLGRHSVPVINAGPPGLPMQNGEEESRPELDPGS